DNDHIAGKDRNVAKRAKQWIGSQIDDKGLWNAGAINRNHVTRGWGKATRCGKDFEQMTRTHYRNDGMDLTNHGDDSVRSFGDLKCHLGIDIHPGALEFLRDQVFRLGYRQPLQVNNPDQGKEHGAVVVDTDLGHIFRIGKQANVDPIAYRQHDISLTGIEECSIGGRSKLLVIGRGTRSGWAAELGSGWRSADEEENAGRSAQSGCAVPEGQANGRKRTADAYHSLSPFLESPLLPRFEAESLLSLFDSQPALSTPAAAYPV